MLIIMLMLMHSRLVLRWTLGYAGIGRQPAPTEDHYSPQKGSRPTQPGSSSNFADGAPLLLIVTSHLLRMVVVALPLTHQKGPRSGIFRAQPSLSGGDSPPTSSQPSSPIEAAPPPRDLSSYTRLSWGTQPHLRGWMVSRSPPHPCIVIPTDSSQPRRSHAITWDPLIITGTVTC